MAETRQDRACVTQSCLRYLVDVVWDLADDVVTLDPSAAHPADKQALEATARAEAKSQR